MIVPVCLIDTRHVELCSHGWHETPCDCAVADMLMGLPSLPWYHFIKPLRWTLTAGIIWVFHVTIDRAEPSFLLNKMPDETVWEERGGGAVAVPRNASPKDRLCHPAPVEGTRPGDEADTIGCQGSHLPWRFKAGIFSGEARLGTWEMKL